MANCFAHNVIIVLIISWLLLVMTHCKGCIDKNVKVSEGFMPNIADVELGVKTLGDSGQLNFNGSGTYYRDQRGLKVGKGGAPYTFIQPIYQKGYSPGWQDNFSQSLQVTSNDRFVVKNQRTDAPHSGWGQRLRVMYGRVWVKGQDANIIPGEKKMAIPPAPQKPLRIWATGDNTINVKLGGRSVVAGSNWGKVFDSGQLSAMSGDVITFVVTNQGGPGGLYVKLDWDGHTIYPGTNIRLVETQNGPQGHTVPVSNHWGGRPSGSGDKWVWTSAGYCGPCTITFQYTLP
jgi:hypothetical protein